MIKRSWIVTLVVLFAATLCLAQANPASSGAAPSPKVRTDSPSSLPAANTTPATARVLIPDGTSLGDSIGATAGVWFTAKVEQGKSYVLETIDPYGDLDNNCINTSVYDSDGTTTPPANAEIDYNNDTAPSLNVSDDGERIAIRPDIGSSFPATRRLNFKVSLQCATSDVFRIRLRESTIYSRWTVNSYNFFTALQNTTATDVQAQIIYYSDAGGRDAVTFNSGVVVPAFGAIQITRPADSISPNHGALRIQWWGLGAGMVPGQLNVQTYAFNIAAGNYLDFIAEKINDGKAANSW